MSYKVSLVQIENLSFFSYMNILLSFLKDQWVIEITMFPEKIFEKFSRIEIVESMCDVVLSMPWDHPWFMFMFIV